MQQRFKISVLHLVASDGGNENTFLIEKEHLKHNLAIQAAATANSSTFTKAAKSLGTRLSGIRN